MTKRARANTTAVCALALLACAGRAVATEFSSSTYISAVLECSPEVRQAQASVQTALNSYQNAFINGFLPSASFSMQSQLYDNVTGDVRLRRRDTGSSAGVNWNLFNTGKDSVALKSARVSLADARLSLQQSKQSRASSALGRFYSLLSTIDLLSVAEQDLADKERQYQLSKRLYEGGFKGLSDLLQSESSLKSSQLSLAQSQASQFKALLEFNTYINREPDAPVTLSYERKKVEFTLPSLASDLSFMTAHLLELQGARLSLESAELGYDSSLLSNLPSVSVDASWQKSGLRGLEVDAPPSYGVAASLSVPLGFFWADKARNISSARLSLARARDSLEQSMRDARLSLIRARTDLEVQLKKFSLYELRSEIARRKLSIMESNYKSGQATSTDLTVAQNDYLDAQNSYTSAIYDTEQQLTSYRMARGELIWE